MIQVSREQQISLPIQWTDAKIPFIVVCDAFQSEMTAFADLILPDTTYLERHDAMCSIARSPSSTVWWIRCACRLCRRRVNAVPSRKCSSNSAAV